MLGELLSISGFKKIKHRPPYAWSKFGRTAVLGSIFFLENRFPHSPQWKGCLIMCILRAVKTLTTESVDVGSYTQHSQLMECMGVLCTWVKVLTNLQIWGCELHKNAFDGRALPGPAGGTIVLPRRSSRYNGDGKEGMGRKEVGIERSHSHLLIPEFLHSL